MSSGEQPPYDPYIPSGGAGGQQGGQGGNVRTAALQAVRHFSPSLQRRPFPEVIARSFSAVFEQSGAVPSLRRAGISDAVTRLAQQLPSATLPRFRVDSTCAMRISNFLIVCIYDLMH